MASKAIRAAQAEARAMGMVIRATGGGPVAHEFEVRYRGQRGDALSYFTEDLDDALATAEVMASNVQWR